MQNTLLETAFPREILPGHIWHKNRAIYPPRCSQVTHTHTHAHTHTTHWMPRGASHRAHFSASLSYPQMEALSSTPLNLHLLALEWLPQPFLSPLPYSESSSLSWHMISFKMPLLIFQNICEFNFFIMPTLGITSLPQDSFSPRLLTTSTFELAQSSAFQVPRSDHFPHVDVIQVQSLTLAKAMTPMPSLTFE